MCGSFLSLEETCIYTSQSAPKNSRPPSFLTSALGKLLSRTVPWMAVETWAYATWPNWLTMSDRVCVTSVSWWLSGLSEDINTPSALLDSEERASAVMTIACLGGALSFWWWMKCYLPLAHVVWLFRNPPYPSKPATRLTTSICPLIW